MTRISSKTRQMIIDEYAAGLPTMEIATRYGVSMSYPTMMARRHGVSRSTRGESMSETVKKAKAAHKERRRLEAIEAAAAEAQKPKPVIPVAEIRRLSDKGLGITRISALLRCPYRVVVDVIGA